MNHLTYVPRAPLSQYVALFWGYEAYGAGHPRERVLPTATSEIVVMLHDDAPELGNVRVPLDTLWGRTAFEVKERLLEARSWPARFRIVEAMLLARLTGRTTSHPAVTFALDRIEAAPHVQTIGRLTERIGLSPPAVHRGVLDPGRMDTESPRFPRVLRDQSDRLRPRRRPRAQPHPARRARLKAFKFLQYVFGRRRQSDGHDNT